MSEPTEKEVSVPWPGKTSIVVTLTTPPKGTEHSGFGLLLGPGAGRHSFDACLSTFEGNHAGRLNHALFLSLHRKSNKQHQQQQQVAMRRRQF
jgi:hypothetical protein